MDSGRDDRPVKPGILEEADIVNSGDAAPVDEAAGIGRPHLLKVLPVEALLGPHSPDIEEDAPFKRELRRPGQHLRRPDAPGEHPAPLDIDAEIASPVCREVFDRRGTRLGADDRRHTGDCRCPGGRPDAPVEVAPLDHGGASPDEVVLGCSALDALEVRDVEIAGREGGEIRFRFGRGGKAPGERPVVGAHPGLPVHNLAACQIDCKNQFHVLNAITIRVKDH